jgi:excinuclease ABC subunit A
LSLIGASDYVIDVGPGAGDEGGRVVASGTPEDVAATARSRTARYLAEALHHPLQTTAYRRWTRET